MIDTPLIPPEYINEMMKDLFKPRLVCICDNFVKSGEHEYAYYKCRSCGGWMSWYRLWLREGETRGSYI